MVDIPAKQKAVVFDQPGTVSTKVVEIDVPEPGAGEVLINLFVQFSFRYPYKGRKLTPLQNTFRRMPF